MLSSVSTTLLTLILDGIDGRTIAIPKTIHTEANDIYKNNYSVVYSSYYFPSSISSFKIKR